MIGQGLYSSATDEWPTPQDLFDELNYEFNFTLDVCANADNAKCPNYFSKEDDALGKRWTGRCWMNPPYGRQIGVWMEKAYKSSLFGATVVCLVPARTDTRWWHDWALNGEIRLLKGRVRFGDGQAGAPFPSAVVVYRRHSWGRGVFPEIEDENERGIWGKSIPRLAPWRLDKPIPQEVHRRPLFSPKRKKYPFAVAHDWRIRDNAGSIPGKGVQNVSIPRSQGVQFSTDSASAASLY